MKYHQWLAEQTTERQELSFKLLETSKKLGEANRKSDTQAIKELEQKLRKLYEATKEN